MISRRGQAPGPDFQWCAGEEISRAETAPATFQPPLTATPRSRGRENMEERIPVFQRRNERVRETTRTPTCDKNAFLYDRVPVSATEPTK